IRTINKTYTAQPNYENKSEIQSNRDKRINVEINEPKVFDNFQRFIEMDNTSRFLYVDIIASAQNNEVTNDTTKTAE
ncbi:44407_t:CDS:1, partial [Gigaspora margarita]